jgi:sporulation protein YlmC with PRC-barrel domain
MVASKEEGLLKMRANEILGLMIRSADGEIGKVEDLLFDGEDWVVRYVVVDTWDWLPERNLVIPPAMLKGPELETRRFDLPMAKDTIADGAISKTGEELTRRIEASIFKHFKLAPYWAARVPGGAAMIADELADNGETDIETPPALKSFGETAGYEVVAGDGPIGHLSDIILDNQSWRISGILVDTTNWLRGGSAALNPRWITGVDGTARKVSIERTRDQVRNDPGYNPLPESGAPRPSSRTRGSSSEAAEKVVQLDLDLEPEEQQ